MNQEIKKKVIMVLEFNYKLRSNSFRKGIYTIIGFLIACSAYAQNTSFVEYNSDRIEFKKLGFVAESMIYYTKSKADYGNIPFNTSSIIRGRVGIEYTKSHEKELSFKTGLYLDLIPFYSFDIAFSKEELNNEYDVENHLEEAGKFVFTIPLIAELKKELADKIIFNTQLGGEFTIMNSGQFRANYLYYDEENNMEVQIFGMYGDTPDFWLLPSLKIGSGIYFVTKSALYQLNISYRKALVPYFEGEYQLGNIESYEATRGSYKMTGDYISLKLAVFLKKK